MFSETKKVGYVRLSSLTLTDIEVMMKTDITECFIECDDYSAMLKFEEISQMIKEQNRLVRFTVIIDSSSHFDKGLIEYASQANKFIRFAFLFEDETADMENFHKLYSADFKAGEHSTWKDLVEARNFVMMYRTDTVNPALRALDVHMATGLPVLIQPDLFKFKKIDALRLISMEAMRERLEMYDVDAEKFAFTAGIINTKWILDEKGLKPAISNADGVFDVFPSTDSIPVSFQEIIQDTIQEDEV